MRHFKSFSVFLLPIALFILATGCAHNTASTSNPVATTAAPVESAKPSAVSVTPTLIAAIPVATTPAPDLAANPASRASTINAALPTIFVAGDSTAAAGSGEAQRGWAFSFPEFFDPAKINVVNRARGGRSSRTFVTEGLWDQLIVSVKPGDIVLIQFGHNDGGAVNDASRARGSLPGIGEETEEIDNLLTKKHEVVHTFGWYIGKMIAETKAKGATPIVLSLTVRDIWKEGKIERGSGSFSKWSAEVAKKNGVQFVNLMNSVADRFDAMGQEKVHALYPRDHTHFNAIGAEIHATLVVSGLKSLPANRVRGFLSAKGEAVEAR